MDEWGVDVVVAGSQKGLMLPTGMAFTGVSAKALARRPRRPNCRASTGIGGGSSKATRRRCGTAPRRCISSTGLQEALRMLEEEGLDNVFARHHRLAEATRRAVRVWRQNDGPEIFAVDPRAQSDSVTAVLTPDGYDANKVREVCLDRFNVSLGGGLGPLQGRLFRIGHLGDLNEPMILGALAAIEMALELSRRAARARRRRRGDGLPCQRGVIGYAGARRLSRLDSNANLAFGVPGLRYAPPRAAATATKVASVPRPPTIDRPIGRPSTVLPGMLTCGMPASPPCAQRHRMRSR